MKKILIIGDDSYIGKAFAASVQGVFSVTMVNSRDDAWRGFDFTGHDCLLHCAGIAHASRNPRMESLYFAVNRDLAVDVANKAKNEEVGQFIYLSSMLVYGGKGGGIDRDTPPAPDDFYGRSKWEAEQELTKMADGHFRLCLVRPPMVYGRNSRGNFPKLAKLAKITPVFPDFPNQRSMIYIENLCGFIRGLIEQGSEGVFLPQNPEYVQTTELVRCVAAFYDRRVITVRLFNPLIRLLSKRIPVLGKLFGDLYYVRQEDGGGHAMVGFTESIKRSLC